jgi:hypothetical protein
MKILPVLDLITDNNSKHTVLNRLTELAEVSTSKEFVFEFNDIKNADVFLFLTHGLDEQQILSIPNHPFVKQFPAKCFLWCDRDVPIPILPGLFAALPANMFNAKLHRTVFYMSKSNNCIDDLDLAAITEPEYLASFQGSMSSNVRKRLLKLKFSSRFFIKATGSVWAGFIFGKGFDNSLTYISEYARLIYNSKFIICPKGNGVSSYRVFETMQAGRVPVIIADKYIAPNIKDNTDDFMLFVKEADIRNLEIFLLEKEKSYPAMAQSAYRVYQQNFSDDRKIHYIGEQIIDILSTTTIHNNSDLASYQKKVLFKFKMQTLLSRIKITISKWLR